MLDQLDNMNDSKSLFVEDNRRPCIIVSKDGKIIHANALFKNKFLLTSGGSFLSLLTNSGQRQWNDFKKALLKRK